MLEVKIKKLSPNATIPHYAHDTDAGLDLTATSYEWDEEHLTHIYGTGLAIEIPDGYVGLIFPRSSNFKQSLSLTNCVGVIDSGYRGEIKFMFKQFRVYNDLSSFKYWDIGDRIGQLIIMPYPKIQLKEVGELDNSDRGSGGFGSTGT